MKCTAVQAWRQKSSPFISNRPIQWVFMASGFWTALNSMCILCKHSNYINPHPHIIMCECLGFAKALVEENKSISGPFCIVFTDMEMLTKFDIFSPGCYWGVIKYEYSAKRHCKNCDEVDNSEDDNCHQCSLFHVEYRIYSRISRSRV